MINNMKIVFEDGDYLVVFTESIFCSGFNVYKANKDFTEAKLINDPLSFFLTLDAAKDFLKKKQEEDKI